ncbi:hypothetical protein OROGR_007219 [Orobanche gracilis]
MNSKALKILLFLFILNSLSLYLYFSSNPDHYHHHHPPSKNHSPSGHYSSPRLPLFVKPWPILPSYLPWSHDQENPPFRSCEAYFGNGFSERADPLRPNTDPHRKTAGAGGWFRCFYSETLRSSVCEGGRIRMIPERILMSKGGEKLESVIGRREDEELPNYKVGAFEIEVNDRSKVGKKLVGEDFLDKYVPGGAIDRHTMRGLIDSIRLVDASDFICSEWIEEPTLLVTRFEYANLFHTVTDWYSTYVASRVTGVPNRPHLVFVDGHCETLFYVDARLKLKFDKLDSTQFDEKTSSSSNKKVCPIILSSSAWLDKKMLELETPLEETWKALYSAVTYAKNFSGPVCFRHAILAPLGYETPLFKGLTENINCRGTSGHELWQKPDNQKTARLSEFGEMIRAAFGFPVDRHQISNPASGHSILFVRREDYLAHPRHGGRVQSRLSNEQEVFDAINIWASTYPDCKLDVVNGLFAHMPMKEQIRAIQDAAIIIGAHGAGLTHIVSANSKAVILEIISSRYRRPHFGLIAQWKGLEYHAIHLDGSYADTRLVTDRLSEIVRSLGC